MRYILILLFPLFVQSQTYEINVYQDSKLALMADDYGNKPFTTDIIFNSKIKHKNRLVAISYEYADLQKYYSRISSGIGIYYSIINHTELSHSINMGCIIRDKFKGASFGINNELSIIISRIKINFLLQSVYRTDINNIRFSCFVGVGYKITLDKSK